MSPDPYGQPVVSGGHVYSPGVLGLDPVTGQAPGSLAAQTRQALINLGDILSRAGSSTQRLVKTTVYYVSTESLAEIDEVYTRHMPDPPPARSAIPCSALPGGLLFCIDAIAALA
jgi:2-iminobutanoate/2-iminopropanoate deaminase